MPKRWNGQDYKGQKFSSCEPEFLDLLADALEGVPLMRLPPTAARSFPVLWPGDPGQALALIDALRARDGERTHVVVAASPQSPLEAPAVAVCEALVLLRRADEVTHAEPARHGQFRVEAVRLGPGTAALPHTGPHTVRVPEDAAAAQGFWRAGDPRGLRNEGCRFGRAVQRLGRVLQGRSVGLALGGGGALGFAHLGLIQIRRAHV